VELFGNWWLEGVEDIVFVSPVQNGNKEFQGTHATGECNNSIKYKANSMQKAAKLQTQREEI
jgi:hypothetical protein